MGWIQGRAYHQDLRERVFRIADAGTPVGGVAKVLQVSVSYVSEVLGRRRRTGEITARPQRGHVRPSWLRITTPSVCGSVRSSVRRWRSCGTG